MPLPVAVEVVMTLASLAMDAKDKELYRSNLRDVGKKIQDLARSFSELLNAAFVQDDIDDAISLIRTAEEMAKDWDILGTGDRNARLPTAIADSARAVGRLRDVGAAAAGAYLLAGTMRLHIHARAAQADLGELSVLRRHVHEDSEVANTFIIQTASGIDTRHRATLRVVAGLATYEYWVGSSLVGVYFTSDEAKANRDTGASSEIAAIVGPMKSTVRSWKLGQASEVIKQAYCRVLERGPDPGGMDAWRAYLGEGPTERDLVRALALSSEYKDKFVTGKTVERVVELLYDHILARPVDPTGAAMWPDVMRTSGYVAVLDGLLGSPEYIGSSANHTIPGRGRPGCP